MNTTEVIRSRRSIRKYVEGVDISKEEIEIMLEAAMMAPSAVNSRPWEFVVVKNREVLGQIMEAQPYTKMLTTASLAIVVCGRPDLQEGRCNAFWPQDCGAAIENLLLQATELGYGTCWCGIYPVEERVKMLREILDVTSTPLAVVAVGRPAEEPTARGYFDAERVKYIL